MSAMGNDVDHNISSTALDEWEQLIIRYNIRPLSSAGYIGCAVYLVIIGVIATVGNLTTLIMFSRNKKLRNKPHNMLLINLAASDLGISVFGYPLTTSSCFAQRYLWGMVGCKVQGFATFFFAMADMYTLTMVSVYRWVAVCVPEYNYILNFSLTMKVILGTWVAAFLTTAPPLVGMSEYTFEPFGTSCTIDWDDPSPLNVFYVYLLVFVAYVLPVAVMCYCYYKVRVFVAVMCYCYYKVRVSVAVMCYCYYKVRVSVAVMCYCYYKVRVSVAVMCYCYYKVVIRSNQLVRAMKMAQRKTMTLGEAEDANITLAENKVTWISLIMVTVFVIIWSPYTFVCVWAIYDKDIPVWLNTLPTMCAKASCMLNPVIFYLTNPVFRNTFMATFCRNKVTPLPKNM
ncbi:visual pigment-like receptor peropsin [Littorina saxatilis]|uniref:visual pigment-like receptor peropsin n=1 Tax=Littorina saxatilis TaxID=31220 RepID=UPI0038B548FC